MKTDSTNETRKFIFPMKKKSKTIVLFLNGCIHILRLALTKSLSNFKSKADVFVCNWNFFLYGSSSSRIMVWIISLYGICFGCMNLWKHPPGKCKYNKFISFFCILKASWSSAISGKKTTRLHIRTQSTQIHIKIQ